MVLNLILRECPASLQSSETLCSVGEDCTTPLLQCAARKNVEGVRLLVENGADVNKADLTGCTPLIAASFGGISSAALP